LCNAISTGDIWLDYLSGTPAIAIRQPDSFWARAPATWRVETLGIADGSLATGDSGRVSINRPGDAVDRLGRLALAFIDQGEAILMLVNSMDRMRRERSDALNFVTKL
jgi:hypothetical protein